MPEPTAPASPLLAPGVLTDPAAPWGMQVAVRYDKVHPPRQVDVAEATARAVVTLLADPRCAPGGPWHEAVEHWRDRRIRKLVRRARGQRWQDVQDLPGATVTQDGPAGWGTAAARAFVPGPVRPLPEALAKTQVEGTLFPTGEEPPPPPAAMAGAGPGSGLVLGGGSLSHDALVSVEVTPLHEMTSGKLAAQCAHAAQLAWQHPALPAALRAAWAADGLRVRVLFPTREQWEVGGRPVSVTDAGYTELDGPTETTRAFW